TQQMISLREEHEKLEQVFEGWLHLDGKMMLENIRKRSRPVFCYSGYSKRAGGDAFLTHAFFSLPQISKDRVVLGGLSINPDFLKETFFPEVLEELIARKATEEGGNRLAMVLYPAESEGGDPSKVLAASAGWGEGNPEVSRNLDDVFRGLTLGIKFQGTSVEAIARRWAMQGFLI